MREFDARIAIHNELDKLSPAEFKEFVYGFMRDSIYDVIDMMDFSEIESDKDARDMVRSYID